jgi:hypothetical protein
MSELVFWRGKATAGFTALSLGHVSRARITQIMNLAVLAPDIQETLLFLPFPQPAAAP